MPPVAVRESQVEMIGIVPDEAGIAILAELMIGGEPRWTWRGGDIVGYFRVQGGRLVVVDLTPEASAELTAEVRRRQRERARREGRGGEEEP